jgi:class 3 adenylate cyclase
MAERIPDAALVELDSADHLIWFSDSIDVMTDEIQDFLTGSVPNREVSRTLATVLAVEVAGGVTSALDADPDGRARGLIDRFRGRAVGTRGGRILATFDGPARAVRCAAAIVAELAGAGVQVGAGLHSGECESVGDDLDGIAVRIVRQIAALAGPGEVLVSQTVRDLVMGSAITFDDGTCHTLADVPGEWRVYAVTAT